MYITSYEAFNTLRGKKVLSCVEGAEEEVLGRLKERLAQVVPSCTLNFILIPPFAIKGLPLLLGERTRPGCAKGFVSSDPRAARTSRTIRRLFFSAASSPGAMPSSSSSSSRHCPARIAGHNCPNYPSLGYSLLGRRWTILVLISSLLLLAGKFPSEQSFITSSMLLLDLIQLYISLSL